MPYTPPSQQSPVASSNHSPNISRSHSYIRSIGSAPPSTLASRSELPRSTSYLNRHRRTPSFGKSGGFGFPDGSSQNGVVEPVAGTGASNGASKPTLNGSIRQSPLPVNDSLMPVGAVISPPESGPNSSDDENDGPAKRRGRELENLAELQAAIRFIEQHREMSPSRIIEEVRKAKVALKIDMPENQVKTSSTPPLSKEARKITHSRSSTENAIVFDSSKRSESPLEQSESDGDGDLTPRSKPQMIRKKSGELVKPALRPTHYSKRRPSSMPGTPTYKKGVHFDSHLEHVRHFLQVDRPLAVSAGSSPVESFESDSEFPFGDDPRARPPTYEWSIKLSNWPTKPADPKAIVKVERVFLAADNKTLIGAVAVANLGFQKFVVARFTLDYWKTTSEVMAEYNHDIRRQQAEDGYDRFNFNIKLADQANLENKTMFFCVRYNVNGQEYWDSNDMINYQVDFEKKEKSYPGKQGMSGLGARPLSALPRSRPSTSGGRPRPQVTSFDDFGDGFDTKYNFGVWRQPTSSLVGETSNSTIRFKGSKNRRPIAVPDDVPVVPKAPAQAFGNRYDFGASLNAAITAAQGALGDRSGLPKKPSSTTEPKYYSAAGTGSSAKTVTTDVPRSSNQPAESTIKWSAEQGKPIVVPAAKPASGFDSPRFDVLKTEKPAVGTTSYDELLDKYCFFGTTKSPPRPSNSTVSNSTRPSSGQLDGAVDDSSVSDGEVGSAKSSGLSTPITPHEKPLFSNDRRVGYGSDGPKITRSASPARMATSGAGSGRGSPISFGYPYHASHGAFGFGDSQTPTAIRG